jgi:hypothetical protein
LYIRLQGDLARCIGSWEGVEWTLLNGNGDVFEKSTDAQISSSEYDSTNTLSSRGSTLTGAIEGIWTVDVPDSFVKMTIEACI